MGKKIYAVRIGKKTGIYETWDECNDNVKGFSGAEYKSFATRKEAEGYLNCNGQAVIEKTKVSNSIDISDAIAYVDGSFNRDTKEFSYGVIIFWKGKEYQFSEKLNNPKLAEMNNVAGELKGSEKAMEFSVENKINTLSIYYDYEGIEKWCTGEWQAKKEGTKAYKAFYESVKGIVKVEFIKVKAHSGDKYNELADKLAKDAMLKPITESIEIPNIDIVSAKEIKNKTHSLRISKDWCDKLINYMKSLENVSLVEVPHAKPKHMSYQFRNSDRDKITFNAYETGKLVIQGKPTYLYSEAIAFLAYCPEITIDDIVQTNNKLQDLNVNASDIRTEIKSIMPNSYDNIDDTIIKMLSPSFTLKKIKLDLEDYSCYAFPALKALEGYLKYLFNLKSIVVGYTFGPFYDYNKSNGQYYLKETITIDMSDEKMKRALEQIYNYFNKNRHTIFHTEQILIVSRILEDKIEADLIINEVINMIENTYNDITN